MPSNTQLTDFDSHAPNGAGSTETVVEPPELTAEDYTVDQDALPDRGVWSDSVTVLHDVTAIVALAERLEIDVSTESISHKLGANQAAYVVDGVDALKQASERTERLYPPSTYTAFEEYDAYVARPTTTFSSGMYGAWGIPAPRFEAAIRLVTGGGRYNAANITVTAMEFRYGWLIEYKGDAFLFPYAKVGQPEKTHTTREVNEITVENEADPAVLNGIRRAMELLPELGIEITGFNERRNNYLSFNTDCGKEITFTGKQLMKLTNGVNDLSEFEGQHEIELLHRDETCEYSWQPGETEYHIGEVIDDEQSGAKRLVYGYTRREKRIRRGRVGDKYGAGMRVYAKPWRLTVYPDKHDDRIKTRVSGTQTEEEIAVVMFDTPDHPDPDELDRINMYDPNESPYV